MLKTIKTPVRVEEPNDLLDVGLHIAGESGVAIIEWHQWEWCSAEHRKVARATYRDIALALNCHNQLVEALRSALGYMQHNARPDDAHWRDVVDEIEAALKAAEGEGK